MKTKERSYSHPVLNPDSDDVIPNKFEFKLEPIATADCYKLKYNIILENKTLTKLITVGDAYFALHVECTRNFYRELFRSTKNNDYIEIPFGEIEGTVEVSLFICAATNLNNYTISDSHADYEGLKFNLEQGDILAIARSLEFEAEKEYDSLQKMSSIMKIDESDKVSSGFIVNDFAEDKIRILLSREDYQKYGTLKNLPNKNSALIQSITLPVLIEAINTIKSQYIEEDQNIECPPRWHRKINQKLSLIDRNWIEKDISSLELAQIILENPFGRFLKDALDFNEE